MRCTILIAFLFGLVSVPVWAADTAELLNRLSGEFALQRESIKTAQITFKIMRTGRTGKWTPDEVHERIKALPLQSLASEMQQLSDQLIEHNPGTDHLPLLAGQLFVDGKKTAERYDAKLKMNEVTIDDKSTTIRDPKNRQVTISRNGSYSPTVTIDQLRFIPPSVEGWTIQDRVAGHVQLNRGLAYMDVDEATGFVHRFWVANTGGIINETWQFVPVQHTGKVMFPSATVTCNYNNNQLRTLIIAVVEKAHFNQDLPAGVFDVAIEEDYVVIDARTDPNSPKVFRANAH